LTDTNQSFVRHTGDGVTTSFPLSVSGADIGYLRTEDIHAYVDDVEVDATIEFSSPHLVQLAAAPEVGADVLLRREMPSDSPYANFERGNVYSPKALNSTFLQQLYLLQQTLDGFLPDGFYEKQNLDMGGNRVINLGSAIDETDAVELGRIKPLEDAVELLLTGLTSNPIKLLSYKSVSTEGQTTITTPTTASSVWLYLDGVKQYDGYSVSSGTVTLSAPLPYGIHIDITLGLTT